MQTAQACKNQAEFHRFHYRQGSGIFQDASPLLQWAKQRSTLSHWRCLRHRGFRVWMQVENLSFAAFPVHSLLTDTQAQVHAADYLAQLLLQ
jgi:hypothetical protein